MKLGFIGTGDIASAIVTGLDRAGYGYDEIVVSRRNADKAARLETTCARVRIEDDNQTIAETADMLFLAVRPQVAVEILSKLRFRSGQIVVSLIALMPHEQIARWTGPDVTIIRAMPLPFVANCTGPTAMFPANAEVEDLFNALGRAIVATSNTELETLVMASCTMGLYFGLEERLSHWLVDKGISGGNARAYIDAINLNLARTGDAERETSLADLREAHSTRGGLNEQLFRVFADHGGLTALEAGLDSIFARTRRSNPSE